MIFFLSIFCLFLAAIWRLLHSVKRQFLQEKNEKETILESLGEGVIAVNFKMQISYVNCIASKMLGIPKRYLIGKTFLQAAEKKPSALLEKGRQLLEVCLKSQQIITDVISFGDLHKRYMDLVASPKAKQAGAVLIFEDKSSHHKVLEMGKDFVSNASHELRTPITIIKGFAETLQDLPELTPEMLGDITEKIVRNCQRMETLVKNLLTLADLEHLPETRFCSCDLLMLIENCRHMVQSVYVDAQIYIDKNKDEVYLDADADILELAIMNLMHNAAKYSQVPAKIEVQVKQKAEEVEISIADQGIGIPEGDLEHIFERFYTVNKAHSRRLGGSGLGLSIVKTIIERHEGTIQASSILNEGTTFTITLPLRR